MKNMTCIVCPKGCSLEIEERGEDYSVEGALCPQGEKYAIQEMTNPLRTLQTTIKTTLPGCRRAAVRTSAEVPLKEIFLFMEAINQIVLSEKKQCGEIVARGLRGTDIDLILTERLY